LASLSKVYRFIWRSWGLVALAGLFQTLQAAPPAGVVQSWASTTSGSLKMKAQADLSLVPKSAGTAAFRQFTVNPTKTYQPFLGVGSSLEHSTIQNLMKMPAATRDQLLEFMFSPSKGLGWSVVRLPFGTSDFTGTEWYTYNDNPPGGSDVTMQYFSIQKDVDLGIIAVLQKARSYNPDLKIIASPWSPPGWMKESGQITTNPASKVKDAYLPALALYYRKAIEAYQSYGIPIYAMTIQNEPGINVSYPNCAMPIAQQITFVQTLRQELDSTAGGKQALATKLWINDFNIYDWETNNYRSVLLNTGARAATDGVAFHDYWGLLTGMAKAATDFPEKGVYLTERAVWGTKGGDRIGQYLRNYSRIYLDWVTMLDSYGQPNNSSTGAGATIFTLNATDPSSYTTNFEAYMIGHYSKFIQRDAVRLESNYCDTRFDQYVANMNGEAETRPNVSNVVFKNPDGSLVMVVVNQSSSAQSLRVQTDVSEFDATVPAQSMTTFTWLSTPSNAPAAPTNLAGTWNQSSTVNLTWTASQAGASPIARYSVYRNGVLLGSTAGAAYADTGVARNTGTYVYDIVAVDTAGLSSAHSASLSISTKIVGATEVIQAEAYDQMSGIQTETCTDAGGGLDVGFTSEGDWLQFNNVDFGTGVKSGKLRFASASTAGGTIDLRLDSVSGSLLVSVPVKPTNGWQTWIDVPFSVTSTASGIHNLYVVFHGTSDVGNLNWFQFGTGTPVPPVPVAPTGLTAVAGNAQVGLAWTASNGATSYDVMLSTTSGSGYALAGNVATTNFTNTGLVNGTKYYFTVIAKNASGSSAASTEATATPAALLAAPTGLTATAGNAQITLGWTAVGGATGYDVLRSTTSGTGYSVVGSSTAPSYVNAGLTNGTTYYYVVVAKNATSSSAHSAQVSARPMPSIPAVPTGVTATVGDAQITLRWTASANATSYDVMRSTTSGSGYALAGNSTTTSFTSTGLTNGTTYYFVVVAKNLAGSSALSAQVSAVPKASGLLTGTFKILSKESGKALDVTGVSTANGAAIQQWTYGGGANQKWVIASTGDGYYTISSVLSGKVLDIRDWSTANGGLIQQWTYQSQDNQKWSIVSTGNGAYKIVSKYSGKALDVKDHSLSDGGQIQQWEYQGGANQQWILAAP